MAPTNGSILDIERELRGEEQQTSFDEWRRTFNEERPHEALAMKRPAEVYQPSPRKFAGTPDDLTYPRMYLVGSKAPGTSITANIQFSSPLH